MYITYDKLWKMLIDKRISKTELAELTGLSSRTVAKLSKNETVTTETLLRLCEMLECDIGDIMETHSGQPTLTFAEAFAKMAEIIDRDEMCITYRMEYNGQIYRIKKSNRSAGRRTEIHCGTDVVWKQYYPVVGGGNLIHDTHVLCRTAFAEKGERGIVLISGKPMIITGLDSGCIVSSRGKVKSPDDVYVMSAAAFKLFQPDGTKE